MVKKRRALIGLSTPIGFDYQNQASKAPADSIDSPNPILDSPFGLLLLFDELVFLTRSLCPENMRQLPYVKFLDEAGRLPTLTEAEVDTTWKTGSTLRPSSTSDRPSFNETIAESGATWARGIDNHSHGLNLGVWGRQANASTENLALDMLIASRLNDPSLELVINSRLQPYFDRAPRQWAEGRLAELLVIDGIPNYLTPKGPYHPVIEEVRENSYLRDFRKWIVDQNVAPSEAEVSEMRKAVEAQMREAQEDLFLKHLGTSGHFLTVGEALVGDAVGILVPGAGTAIAVADEVRKWQSSKHLRWQGFLLGAKRSLRKGN